jgi:transcriptional regulator with XRE-family HTH domain
MIVNPIALSIRAKKLGVLIRDARKAAGKSTEECARVLGVSAAAFEEYELGGKSPSLPELEVLAYYLDVPLEHFWSNETFASGSKGKKDAPDFKQAIMLRQRMIGAMIRQARLDAGLTLEEVAEKTWSAPSLVESYELGEMSIPLPDLEALSQELDRTLQDFEDRHGPVGRWTAQQNAVQDFLDLDPELRTFVGKPINRPYLELAQRLSEMSVEKLRAVAEGLLEITL